MTFYDSQRGASRTTTALTVVSFATIALAFGFIAIRSVWQWAIPFHTTVFAVFVAGVFAAGVLVALALSRGRIVIAFLVGLSAFALGAWLLYYTACPSS